MDAEHRSGMFKFCMNLLEMGSNSESPKWSENIS